MDLDHYGPERLVDEIDPLQLAETVENLDAWTKQRLSIVDDVLTAWLADFVARAHDREGLIALQSAILRILQAKVSRAAQMGKPEQLTANDYARRWKGYADTIEARDITLAERAPDRVRKLKHVAAIEALIPVDGSVKQSDLLAGTKLAPSRLSQILSLMEAHGMIERAMHGREKYVSRTGLPKLAPVAMPDARADTVKRGASYLAKAA